MSKIDQSATSELLPPPSGLLTDLMAHEAGILHTAPQLGWIVPSSPATTTPLQTAYQIHLFHLGDVQDGACAPLLWDSGRVASPQSLAVPYAGPMLQPGGRYGWRVRVWFASDIPTAWSAVAAFTVLPLADTSATADRTQNAAGRDQHGARFTTSRYDLLQLPLPAVRTEQRGNVLFADFSKAMFATLSFTVTAVNDGATLTVRLGEKLAENGVIDTTPPGTVRYQQINVPLRRGTHDYRLALPADARNTGKGAVHLPAAIGVVFPFRYAELAAGNGGVSVDPASLWMIAAQYPFDDDAAAFSSSDETLDAVYALCKHTIKATTFCGVYVDGDRERIPYEGDAYINQLSHYALDREFTLARYSHEFLIQYPTWPTDWILHSVLMAGADFWHTGDLRSATAFYDDLCAKSLLELADLREDGLLALPETLPEMLVHALHLDHPKYTYSHYLRDLVDWPPGSFTAGGTGERDDHEMVPVNTVVNALHYRALVVMSELAQALGKADDAERFTQAAMRLKTSFNALLFDVVRGVYCDGLGSSHASQHSNMFALAVGLVPAERVAMVAAFVKSRGMACSVYGAQYLLEALYEAGVPDAALALMTATHDRGWKHMLDAGSTMTWEAWDHKYKNNLDWNHAWATAPANIIPRYLMGIRPLEPGFGRVRIAPQPAGLTRAELKLPTVRGTILTRLEQTQDKQFSLDIALPGNVEAEVILPLQGDGWHVAIGGKETAAEPVAAHGGGLRLPGVFTGSFRVTATRG